MAINNINTKVAVIEPVGGHGGMDYYDYGLCDGVSASGIDVALYTCDETKVPTGQSFEVLTVYKKIFGDDSSFIRAVRYFWGTTKTLYSCLRNKRTIVHFHWFHVGPLELFNIICAKLIRRKIVVTAHDVEAFAEGLSVSLFVRIAYNLCDSVIAHNEVSRGELIEKISIPSNKINVIPHGNYFDLIQEMPDMDVSRKELGIPENAKVLLFFGQIKDVKGLDVLLEALKTIITKHSQVILVIAGKVWKTDFSKYDELINTYGIRDNCLLDIRYIPDNEISNYYSAANLVVLPYRRIYQSGVLLMAMSFGRSVVVSDLPGMLEVVTDNETGFVFRNGDSDNLSSVINSALENPSHIKEISVNAKNLMEKQYDWKKIGRSVVDIYNNLNGPV